MPHCILEYSANTKIDPKIPEFLTKLNQELATTGVFVPGQIKSRARMSEVFEVGSGQNTGFIFLQISLLSGREQKQKEEIGRKALLLMREFFSSMVNGMECSVTVELREISRELHFSLKDL